MHKTKAHRGPSSDQSTSRRVGFDPQTNLHVYPYHHRLLLAVPGTTQPNKSQIWGCCWPWTAASWFPCRSLSATQPAQQPPGIQPALCFLLFHRDDRLQVVFELRWFAFIFFPDVTSERDLSVFIGSFLCRSTGRPPVAQLPRKGATCG